MNYVLERGTLKVVKIECRNKCKIITLKYLHIFHILYFMLHHACVLNHTTINYKWLR